MNADLRVLTVHCFGELKENDSDVTIAPHQVAMVVTKKGIRQDRELNLTAVFFIEGTQVEVALSDYDLLTLQQAVGSYHFAY